MRVTEENGSSVGWERTRLSPRPLRAPPSARPCVFVIPLQSAFACVCAVVRRSTAAYLRPSRLGITLCLSVHSAGAKSADSRVASAAPASLTAAAAASDDAALSQSRTFKAGLCPPRFCCLGPKGPGGGRREGGNLSPAVMRTHPEWISVVFLPEASGKDNIGIHHPLFSRGAEETSHLRHFRVSLLWLLGLCVVKLVQFH